MKKGLIFDIKRYAINDGPGIRVTIFLKGCPLSCKWCHNPESLSTGVQKMYTESKCIGSKECILICPNDALSLSPKGIVTNGDACMLCGKCAEACPTKAIEMSGKIMSVDELVKIVEKERMLFDQSDGGVTISGGEPLMHADFLINLLDACKTKEIHTTVDTTGFADTKTLMDVAKRTDHFLYDLKIMDHKKHKHYTGVNNKIILHNLKELAESGASINIRIPLIKNVNADDKNMISTAEFISGLPDKNIRVNLLPYHNIAIKKYEKLGQDYDLNGMEEPSKEEQEHIIGIFNSYGIDAMSGG